ncbi:MAG: hypothetical protein AAF215_20165 [Cyanobacteria bacterium P01_A01_bin.123]
MKRILSGLAAQLLGIDRASFLLSWYRDNGLMINLDSANLRSA